MNAKTMMMQICHQMKYEGHISHLFYYLERFGDLKKSVLLRVEQLNILFFHKIV